MNKKHFSLILALVTVCAVFTACSTGGNGGGSTVTDDASKPAETYEYARPSHISKDDFGGDDFTILETNLNADTVISRDFMVSEDSGDVVGEAQYRRNKKVEEELSLNIITIVDYSSSNSGLSKVRQANIAGDNTYDLCIISTYDAASLAMSGDLRNLNGYGCVDLSESWWDQNIVRDLSIGGKVYFTTGDISLVTTMAMYNVLFNKDMFNGNGWEYPYQLVRDGQWTFDKMKEYIMQVSNDLDANGTMDSNDLYGLVYIHSSVIAALGMSGEKMATINAGGEIELTAGSERAEKAVTDFITLTQDKEHVYNGQSGTGGVTAVRMFGEGHCLFRMIEHIGFPYFRDTELDYGILPLPKLDETQTSYYTPIGGWDAAFVCVPTSVQDDVKTSTFMEYAGFVSQKIVTPSYYERTLVGRYIRDDESYDMITLEMQNRTYDIGYIYNFGGIKDGIETLSKRYSTSYTSMFNSYRSRAFSAIASTNEAFLSDN